MYGSKEQGVPDSTVYFPNSYKINYLDNKVHGANMGPTWGRQDPGGSHVGPMNFAIWVPFKIIISYEQTLI